MNILIAIEGCEAHRDRWPVLQETWARSNSDYMPIALFPFKLRVQWFDGEKLGVPDDYLSLPQKTKAICSWSRKEDYDFTLVCDTDSYVSLPRAINSGFENYDYSGFVQTWLPVPYCSGPSYWLSKKACEAVAMAQFDQYEVPGHATDEDVMVGSVLFHRGFRYHHDERYVNAAGVLPENDVISYHLTFHAPYSHERMYECHRRALGHD